MEVVEEKENEVRKDGAKFLNKKNGRVTARHMSDRRKQTEGHVPETGREVVRKRRNLI
jgi:hypothetical protein